MKYVAALVLFLAAIVQNVVASLFSPWLLPFGWPILAASLPTSMSILAAGELTPAWSTRPRSFRRKWIGATAGIAFVAFLFVWGVVRFCYGSLELVDSQPLQAFSNDTIEVKGNNFALTNPKINTARLTLADGQTINVTVIDVVEGRPQKLKLTMPDEVPAGRATLVIDGPMSLVYRNRVRLRWTCWARPRSTGSSQALHSAEKPS
jgi:hypothetical protein